MILITGAGRGIGKYLLENYIINRSQHHIFGTFNTTMPEYEYAEHYKQVDLLQDKLELFVKEIPKESLGNIVLVNCAGINYNAFAHKADMEKWEEVIQVNLIGTFRMINTFLPIMREQGYGRIINLSSVVSQMHVPATSAYAASKAGLTGMIKSIAVENVSKGITINNINLGYHDIGMIEQVPKEYQEHLKKTIPAGKFGDPEQIYNTINYIIENDYLTGTSIDINGGLH